MKTYAFGSGYVKSSSSIHVAAVHIRLAITLISTLATHRNRSACTPGSFDPAAATDPPPRGTDHTVRSTEFDASPD
ncbi:MULTISPECIES: hypothetical protein [unclassified Rhodococcus (in: high G+C Gram-positive bacteria)]|uniref:hypothetical protein n=1 Tax=unclassified Rhodococcus (in: high G+C Gram-positive bacteria) TaxID=192944 RepID=UPI003390E425